MERRRKKRSKGSRASGRIQECFTEKMKFKQCFNQQREVYQLSEVGKGFSGRGPCCPKVVSIGDAVHALRNDIRHCYGSRSRLD